MKYNKKGKAVLVIVDLPSHINDAIIDYQKASMNAGKGWPSKANVIIMLLQDAEAKLIHKQANNEKDNKSTTTES